MMTVAVSVMLGGGGQHRGIYSFMLVTQTNGNRSGGRVSSRVCVGISSYPSVLVPSVGGRFAFAVQNCNTVIVAVDTFT